MSTSTEIQGGGRALTPQRAVVLQVVRARAEHMTAAEIYTAARKLRPSLSYATVYNSLRYLKEAGLLRRVTFRQGAGRPAPQNPRPQHAIFPPAGKILG